MPTLTPAPMGAMGTKFPSHKRGMVYRDRTGNLWRGSNRATIYPILPTGERVPRSSALRLCYVERWRGPLTSDAETERLSQ